MSTVTKQVLVDIYVRHSKGCKYEGDEKAKRCDCRKHLRWRQDGAQHRMKANTRSWATAEVARRELEDKLNGRVHPDTPTTETKLLSDAIEQFMLHKKVQGVSDGVAKKYARLLDSLLAFAKGRGVLTAREITNELILKFVAKWPTEFPSYTTRVNRRETLGSFFKYCHQEEWLRKLPVIPKEVRPSAEDVEETQPLTAEEYKRLLDAVYVTVGEGDPRRRSDKEGQGRGPYGDTAKLQQAVYAFLQTMRWSGLAPIDTLTLKRTHLTYNADKSLYYISRSRSKSGVPVKIPISKKVGDDLMKVEKISNTYFFWSGNGKPQSAMSNWGQRYIAPVFREAGISNTGNMLSYRLRDTYAVHLLEHGASMEEVARLLGNSVKVCERHYAKWSKLRQDKVDALAMGTFEASPATPSRVGRKPAK